VLGSDAAHPIKSERRWGKREAGKVLTPKKNGWCTQDSLNRVTGLESCISIKQETVRNLSSTMAAISTKIPRQEAAETVREVIWEPAVGKGGLKILGKLNRCVSGALSAL
jgi:hypothetical protein